MIQVEREEFASYLFLLLGVTIDQISTKVGISSYNLFEFNLISARLIELGVWGYTDTFICIMFIAITFLSYRLILEEKQKIVFAFPLITGIIRLLVGILNFTLL